MACDQSYRHRQRQKFTVLVRFIEKRVRIVCDLVFGDLQDSATQITQKDNKYMTTIRPNTKLKSGTSFAIGVAVMKSAGSTSQHKPQHRTSQKCRFCNKDHLLELCSKFKILIHREKIYFLKVGGICFGCLSRGHMSRDCKTHPMCSVCNRSHPSLLHIGQKDSYQGVRPSRFLPLSSVVVSICRGKQQIGPVTPCVYCLWCQYILKAKKLMKM